MDSRIKITKDDNKLEIIIKAFIDAKKQTMLLVWIFLFSLCGLSIVSQFFEDYESSYKIVFGVYVAFWLFFEFKVIYAYRWRKYGEERVIIENNQITLLKTIGKRGVTQNYNLDEIKKIDFLKNDGSSFIKSMNSSYWNINKYHLALYLENTVIPFAIDVENKDAKHILNELRKFEK
jgi:hypothetical protein